MIILIEAQWNLKRNTIGGYEVGKSILIEAQWNLKFGSLIERIIEWMDINRSTVEFKADCCCNSRNDLSLILIEAQWNLKSAHYTVPQ